MKNSYPVDIARLEGKKLATTYIEYLTSTTELPLEIKELLIQSFYAGFSSGTRWAILDLPEIMKVPFAHTSEIH